MTSLLGPFQSAPDQAGGALPAGVTISQGGPGQDPAGTLEIGSGFQGGVANLSTRYRDQQLQAQNAAGGAGSASSSSASGGPLDPSQQNADAIIQQLLDSYGLGSLASWAYGLVTQGLDANAIQLLLYQRPEFKARFPAIDIRQKAGLPPISPGEYVSYENQVAQLGNQYGIPKQFTDQFVTQWIGGDVSLAEVGQRTQDYAQAVYQSNPAVVNQLKQLYGVTDGELTSFFMDPTTALPLITKRFQAAQIAGQAQVGGFQQLSQAQAELLANQGVSQAQAQSGFQHLGLESQLFNPLPGQAGQPTIGTDQQLGAEFLGNAADARAIQMAALTRQAAFQGGGQFSNSSKGLTGLGTEQGSQS